ncbi:MAG: glycosyltransferase [Muribaculaceae bacterium]|nr:glycosyltransferase [Muribaculaceae bacterium]
MVKRKRILFLIESLNIGGAEKALISLLRQFDYNRFDVTLELIAETGGFIEELKKIPNLKVKRRIRRGKNGAQRIYNKFKSKLIYQWLPKQNVGNSLCKGYDTVVAFTEGYLTKWVGASTVKCKKIAWIHTDMVDNDWPTATGIFSSVEEEAQCYSKFDEVIGVSNFVSKGVCEKFRYPEVKTIYNLLDPEIIEKANSTQIHLSDAEYNAVAVGRLEHVKGFDILIEAINLIVKKGDINFKLTIVGDGRERDSLQALVDKYKIKEYVVFKGFKQNPYPYIQASDLFICPSRREGFNIAILEAMRLGKPIVSTEAVGPKEILNDGEFGIITRSDSQALAAGIIKMLETNNLNQYKELSIQRSKDFNSESGLHELYSIL